MKKTLKILLWLMTGAQIVFGLIWLVAAFRQFPQFSLSAELMEASRTWVLDEYMGIGYPILIRIGMVLESWVKIPFFVWIYGLQIALAFCSGCYLLSAVFCQKMWKFDTIWGSLYLLTIPMAAQCHMAVLPFSLALSLLFWIVGILLKSADKNANVRLRQLGCLFVLLLLLVVVLPETFWMAIVLGTAAVIGTAVLSRNRRKVLCLSAVLILALSLGFTCNQMLQVPGSRGNIHKSVSSAVLSRVVWPYFDMDYYFWPAEIKEVMSEEMAWTVSCNPERVKDLFGPVVEERYGSKHAKGLYLQMAKASFEVRTKDITKQIVLDLAAYACPQISVNLELDGVGTGLNAYNYNQMKEVWPTLTKYYVNYSLHSFVFALFLSFVCLGYRKAKKVKYRNRQTGILVLLLAVPVLWQIVYYTFTSAGMIDYKNVLFVAAGYGIWIVYGMTAMKEKGDNDGQDCSIDTVL